MKTFVFCIPIVLFLLSGCNNQPTMPDEHYNEHEGETAGFQYTAYSEDLELFAEASPFVLGETAEILAHFSWLKNFKPLTEGSITLSLITGNKGIRVSLDGPERPGIYRFRLKPETAGKGKLVFDIKTNQQNYSITVPGIEVFEDEDEDEAIHEAEEAIISSPNGIVFTKEQSWKIDFATDYPVEEPFGTVIKTTALVEPAQGDETVISAKTNGIIGFGNQMLAPGTSVLKNKTLFTISGKNMADNNLTIRFNEAKNIFEKAKANFERLSALADDKIVSQKELLESKTEYENAKVVFENLKENFNENGQPVASPVDGYIKHIQYSQGDFVEAGQAVLTVARNKNLFLKAEVQQKYQHLLPDLNGANIILSQGGKVLSLEELNGKIISWGKSVSDESFLIPVTLQVENNDDLFPGSIVDINLKSESKNTALIVPTSALIEEQGNYFVFVQLTPELFEKREIKPGDSDGLNTVITQGISASDRIVTRGGILVKLAAVSNNLDPHAGHVH
ncbi:MAG: efflux RND transporter periplasmic adaptor subunit [Prolixibacteraceae bacterium]|nr:efflux RND transporter periplasmic adaptor subunit [Prolixibacteraceae bacterium]